MLEKFSIWVLVTFKSSICLWKFSKSTTKYFTNLVLYNLFGTFWIEKWEYFHNFKVIKLLTTDNGCLKLWICHVIFYVDNNCIINLNWMFVMNRATAWNQLTKICGSKTVIVGLVRFQCMYSVYTHAHIQINWTLIIGHKSICHNLNLSLYVWFLSNNMRWRRYRSSIQLH